MRVLYLGLRLVTDFFFFKSSFRLFFVFFNRFAFLQVLHCHYQSQASSMPSKEEWFTYDTTVFLHLNNHIHNQRREKKNERKQRNDGHLQHIMATLTIIYNLCFEFFLFSSYWCVTLICRHSQTGDIVAQSEKKVSVTPAVI